ncbi:MAG TPA: glycerol-3-phosphate 1-O-acyltransferase PlsY [Myxococcales bacterium]|nr:glycerol-3-phosphate 1-O-acyltransferase PlsY [Myxococcales bacterium]
MRGQLAPLWANFQDIPALGVSGVLRLAVALIVVPYLVGSIPFGILVARLFSGVDVRTVGSHNIGATNVARAAGKGAGVLTLVLDALKGALPTLVAVHYLGTVPGCIAGLAAFLGHLFPVFLRGKGGKGVATALGVFAVLSPWAAPVGLATYGVVLALTRVSALGSLAGSTALLIAAALLRYPAPVLALCVAINLLIYWRHRGNLSQLLRKRR